MKRYVLIAGLVFLGIFFACDDISGPAPNPRAERKKEVKEEVKKREVSKQELIQTYNLIIEIRNGLVRWQEKLDEAKKTSEGLFTVRRNKFREWAGHYDGMLAVRQEWYDPKKNKFPSEHPAVPLWLAIRSARDLIESYIYHNQLGRPLNPSIETELRKWLDEFKEKVDKWEFPEYKPAPPPKIKQSNQ